MSKKFARWKEKLLSIGGREILTKAIAQAVPTYAMGCFLLPKTLCNDLERIMRNFWWGQRNQESKLAWGGIGFRSLQAFNLPLLAKKGWQILTNYNSLVPWVYKAKYFPFDDILSAKIGSNPIYT